MFEILKLGAQGQDVANLQTLLKAAGFNVSRSHIYDDDTQSAVKAFQRARGLIVDGQYGPKTAAALAGSDTSRMLKESDLIRAAESLGLPLATIKAINEVESNGTGYLKDGRPKILFERHVFYKQLLAQGIDPLPHAARMPGIVNKSRGGYAGGAAEYSRLAVASEISVQAAQASTSWGAFQIMGFHWKALGYASVSEFVACMNNSEGDQLDAFMRFIKLDPALVKALARNKWTDFARRYNGPAYAENLYDVKLARAYERYTEKAAA